MEYKNGDGDGGNTPPADDIEVKKAIGDFLKTFEEFKSKSDAEIKQIRDSLKPGNTPGPDAVTAAEVKKLNDALDAQKKLIDEMRLDRKRTMLTDQNGDRRPETDDEKKHREAIHLYMRKGVVPDLDGIKTLSVGSDPDGGYTVHPQMEATIDRVLSEVSPIRAISSVQQISTSSYKRILNVGGATSGWVGEQSSRPQTNNATLREREFPAKELYAMPAATQSILDDSAINLEQWIADEVNTVFAEQEGAAFVMGDGASEPKGLVGGYTPIANASFTEAGGRPGYVATGASGAFKTTAAGDDSNNLIDLVYSIKSGYRANARWIMSRTTQQAIRKIQDVDGNKIWQPGLVSGQPATLLGFPITEAEDMPTIAADSYSIAFGDFRRAYQIVDRVGVRVLRDPYSSKPYVLFYTTKRVGGGVKLFEAYKLLKFGTS